MKAHLPVLALAMSCGAAMDSPPPEPRVEVAAPGVVNLVDEQGGALDLAHVAVDGGAWMEVADGRLEIPPGTSALVELHAAAPGRHPARLLLRRDKERLEVQLRLARGWGETFDAAMARCFRVPAQGEAPPEPVIEVPLVRQHDLLVAEVTTDEAQLACVGTGVMQGIYAPVAAARMLRLEKHGYPFYAGVVEVSDGKAVVRVPIPPSEPSVLSAHGATPGSAQELLAVQVELAEREEAYSAAVDAQFEAGSRDLDGVGLEPARIERLETAIAATTDPVTRRARLVAMFADPALWRPGAMRLDPELARELLAVPVSSRLWSIRPSAAIAAASATGSWADHLDTLLAIGMQHCTRDGAIYFYSLLHRLGEEGDREQVRRAYEVASAHLEGKPNADAIRRFAPGSAIQDGKTLPPFDFPEHQKGRARIRSDDLRGSWVLLKFWASWCGPCVAEMPDLHALYADHGGKGFEIVSINVDDSEESIARLRKAHPDLTMPWREVILDDEASKEARDRYEIFGLPSAILVAPDGTIHRADPELTEVSEVLRARIGD